MAYRSPKTGKAARLDAEGMHNEAIVLLSKAGMDGDMDAMTQLGKRLLLGEYAPRMPKDGARLLLEAARESHPEAVAMMAILQCLGIFQRKNWQDALNSLTHAARLGWLPARAQLLLLDQEFAAADHWELIQNGPDSLWEQLGSRIDINAWFRIPAGSVLSDSPMVVAFDDFIPEQWRRFLIEYARERLRPSYDPDPLSMRNCNAKVSTYSIAQIGLANNGFLHFLLQERMSKACGMPIAQMEGMAVLNFQPGQEFSEHCDFFDVQRPEFQQQLADYGQRLITFLIWLNDDYEAGDLEFTQLGLTHKGKAGSALYFVNGRQDGSADTRTAHAGRSPQGGQKWILSQYFRSRSLNFISDVRPE